MYVLYGIRGFSGVGNWQSESAMPIFANRYNVMGRGNHEINNHQKNKTKNKKKTMSLTFCNFSKFEARLYLINVLIETSFYIPINFRNNIIANTWLYRYLDCDQF